MARKLRADDHCRTEWVRHCAHCRAANRRDADHVEPQSPTSFPSGSPGSKPAESFTANQPCMELVSKMSRSEQVGQLLMVAVSSSGMDPSEEAIVDRTRAGSVLLLGNSTAGMQAIKGVVSQVRDAARSPKP